ncbi:MAG: hypothetical protein H0V31_09965 [Acidobacteria bacterium]|jgi:hypothetical protein|nr:hypothetical protein [Acidobacteriota bacterium]
MKNLQEIKETDKPKFVEGADFLKKRGYCCKNGCRHCPYPKEQNEKLQ